MLGSMGFFLYFSSAVVASTRRTLLLALGSMFLVSPGYPQTTEHPTAPEARAPAAPETPAPPPAAAPAASAPAAPPYPYPPPASAAPPGYPPNQYPGYPPSTTSGQWVPSPDGKTYVQVPPGYEAPLELPYREGQPIPSGYHLEERPRRGAVITGYVLGGVGYGAAVLAALGSDFANHSGWLLLPVVGPWLTLGLRDYHDCSNQTSSDSTSSDYDSTYDEECVEDGFAMAGLIIDGMLQAAGATLVFIGHAAPKQVLVRGQISLRLTPLRVGPGYGLGVMGAF